MGSSAKLISIIGPPAVGKTTLAEFLAAHFAGPLVREDYAGNPFLASSFEGDAQARLPGQLYFLMSRVSQLSVCGWPAGGVVVTDYGFCQDGIFAAARLQADELRLYERVSQRLAGLVRPPDVVIWLDASERTLLGRIATRGRGFERAMDAAFLARLRELHRAAAGQLACPVIAVNCDARDLLLANERAALAADVAAAIRC